MSWSTYTSFALTGKPETIRSVQEFILSLPVLDGTRDIRDLKALRKALYGKKFKPENNREIGNGPGSVLYIEMKETDGQPVFHFCIEATRNIFETRRFLKAMHRKFGSFNSVLLLDDIELTGNRIYTTDRKGYIFPHFALMKGTKEDFGECVENWNPFIEGETIPNTKELIKELRKEGIRVRSFKEFTRKYPNHAVYKEDGTALAIYAINSPNQHVDVGRGCANDEDKN